MIKNMRSIGKLIYSKLQPKDIEDSDLEYLLWIMNLYNRIHDVPGHIAEIGVADGRNSVLFGLLIKMHNDQSTRQYIGFDTFDGYAERDMEQSHALNEVNQRWKSCSKTAVERRCARNGVEKLVEIFEGDAVERVPEILQYHRGRKFLPGSGRFALVYIDCNAYVPALKSLEAFLPHMMPGGIFAIDEKLQGGETAALVEFAEQNGLVVQKRGPNQVPMSIVV